MKSRTNLGYFGWDYLVNMRDLRWESVRNAQMPANYSDAGTGERKSPQKSYDGYESILCISSSVVLADLNSKSAVRVKAGWCTWFENTREKRWSLQDTCKRSLVGSNSLTGYLYSGR